MKELNLNCDFSKSDRIEVEVAGESDKVEIAIHSNGHFADVLIGKEKAAKLRDWLNEFLGESK